MSQSKGIFLPGILTIIFLFILVPGFKAQAVLDSTHVMPVQGNKVLKKMIVPTTLILGGFIISGGDFEKRSQTDIRAYVGKDFKSEFDNYARYAPIAQMYAADILGVKSKNHWFDQSKNLVIAIVVTDFITTRMKRSINKKRPGNIKESFPSGHTSLAFTTAGMLYQEFKGTSPVLAYSGFGFATATAGLRVMKNTHWISDVIMGAGIGILVTEVIYLFDPIIKWNPFLKNDKKINFIPRYDGEQYGFYLSMQI